MNHTTTRRGFTLIELLVVIAIIAIFGRDFVSRFSRKSAKTPAALPASPT